MAALKITGAGATAEYLGQKVSVKKHFDTFAATDASELGGIKWDALSEETLCSKDVYERFAYFLMQVHPNGLKLGLDGSTAGNYIGIVINLAQDKFKATGSAESRLFFSCLDKQSSSPDAIWLRKLKSNIMREHIERAKLTGTPLDKSAAPIYLPTIKKCIKSIGISGSTEAATRRLALWLLWASAGRSSETATITFDGLEWDEEMLGAFVEIIQSKGGKFKLIVLSQEVCPYREPGAPAHLASDKCPMTRFCSSCAVFRRSPSSGLSQPPLGGLSSAFSSSVASTKQRPFCPERPNTRHSGVPEGWVRIHVMVHSSIHSRNTSCTSGTSGGGTSGTSGGGGEGQGGGGGERACGAFRKFRRGPPEH